MNTTVGKQAEPVTAEAGRTKRLGYVLRWLLVIAAVCLTGQTRWSERHRFEKRRTDTMGDTTWQGVTDVLDAAANWDGGIPGTTEADLVGIFDGSISQRSPQANMDQSGAVHNFSIVSRRNFGAPIGSDGNPLKFNGTASDLAAQIHGTGATHLFLVSGNNSDVIVDQRGANGSAVFLDGAVLGLMIKSGTVVVKPTCALGDMAVLDGPQAFLTILQRDSTEGTPLKLIVQSGQVVNERDYPVAEGQWIRVTGGTVWQTGLLDTGVTLDLPSGRLTYIPSSDPSAKAPNAFVMGGTLDLEQYGGAIPFGRVVKGRNGQILGTVTSLSSTFPDYDLSEEWN